MDHAPGGGDPRRPADSTGPFAREIRSAAVSLAVSLLTTALRALARAVRASG